MTELEILEKAAKEAKKDYDNAYIYYRRLCKGMSTGIYTRNPSDKIMNTYDELEKEKDIAFELEQEAAKLYDKAYCKWSAVHYA